MTNHFWKGLMWSLLLSAILWFSYGSIYYYGYKNGQAAFKCQLHNCTEYVLKYGSCDLGKTSNYPKLSNYKGRR